MIGATEFQAGALDKRYHGVVIGVVTSIVDPDNLGRVMVKFPWYDDQTQTMWCRVAYPYAGPGYGFFAVPEKDSEVLVAFDHGDMRIPYILGGLHNGVDKPATYRKEDDVRDEKLLRTRGGHQLLLRDTKSKTLIELTTSGGHKLEMDDAGKKVTLTTAAGEQVVLESGKVTVTAKQVTLNASKVELGPSASQSLIFGEAFMTLFNAHVHTSSIPGTPTSPPVTPMTPAVLSTISKTA